MEQSKIDRINALAKKAKTEGLTEAETAERKALREEYIAHGLQGRLRTQLDNMVIVEPNGERRKLKPKK